MTRSLPFAAVLLNTNAEHIAVMMAPFVAVSGVLWILWRLG